MGAKENTGARNTREALILAGLEEIRKMIGADSLGYMQIDYLEGMAGGLPLCKACFDGNYPMEIPEEIKQD